MFEKQFESFLVDLLIKQKASSIDAGHRYHFRCPDKDNRITLINAFDTLISGNVIDGDNSLDYIQLPTCKLIFISQDETGKNGVTENYISTLRDKIAGQLAPFEECALLAIHNCMLDTWLTSAKNLASEGHVWHPVNILKHLKPLVTDTLNKDLSECLLDYRFDVILDDGATVFGFSDLYGSLDDGIISFNELELFEDSKILEFKNNKKQMSKRLEENRKLFKRINEEVHRYPETLVERLQEFSRTFVRKYFVNADKWKHIEFQVYLDEMKRNKVNAIVFDNLESESGLEIYRTRSQKNADARRLHVILPVTPGVSDFEFKLTFDGTDIEKKHLVFDKKSKLNAENVSLRSSQKKQFISIKGIFTESPFFFAFSIKRDKSSENHTFSCMVIGSNYFNIDDIKTIFTINVGKRQLVLHTDTTMLKVGRHSNETAILKNLDDTVDINKYGILNYGELSEQNGDISFILKSGEELLNVKVGDEISNHSLILPFLLDKTRNAKMFNSVGGQYNKKRVIIENKEIKPTETRLHLLEKESEFVKKSLLTLGYEKDLSVNDIKDKAPELHVAYVKFFEYLAKNLLLPSLSFWNKEFTELVREIVTSYTNFLSLIEDDTTLDKCTKDVLSIGMVLSSDDVELMSPYHPLVLSYYLYFGSKINNQEDDSFRNLPDVTISRLNPRGLLPFIYNSKHGYCNAECFDENSFWLKQTPYEKCSYNYVKKLVKEKIIDFTKTFSDLFSLHSQAKLHLNSINNGNNKEIFLGLTEYFKKYMESSVRIHINIYDDELTSNYFDEFSELRSYEDLRCLLGLPSENANVLIDLMRSRLTYSKFINDSSVDKQEYAHISFFYNHEKVSTTQIDINKMPGGVAADGILSGEAIKIDENIYYSQLGLKDIDYENSPHLTLAYFLNTLMYPWKEDGERFFKGKSRALKIGNSFRDSLEKSYASSIWTTVIDPKVTLKFFNTEGALLIHYSDQYTNSAGYDAVTVTKRSEIYQKVLQQNGGGNVSEFSAFNGEWLLKMLNQDPKTEKSRKEKTGIVGAYKLVFEILYDSKVVWVPLSIAEVIRVSGNIGLKMDDSEFSRNVKGYKKGAISDDILYVGFKDNSLYLLPVEVKTGQRPDYKKAIEQAKELRRYLIKDILGPRTFEGQLYRSLFVRQVMMQIEKYQMYDIFPKGYFDLITVQKEQWLSGKYELGQIKNYPEGMVVANVSNETCFEEDIKPIGKILKIELPIGWLESLLSIPLKDAIDKKQFTKLCSVPSEYILNESIEFEPIDFNKIPISEQDNAISYQVPQITSQMQLGMEAEKQEPSESASEQQANKLSDKRVLIGTSSNGKENIYWEYGNKALPNRHMVIFGGSGEGKTYCIQGLLMEIAASNVNSMVVDYTNGFLPEHLECEFLERVKPSSHWVAEKPLPINPFMRHSHNINGRPLKEKSHIVAGRIASVFNSVYSSIGEQQLPTLANVIEEGIDLFENKYSFRRMIKDLEETGKVGELLANKLSTMVKSDLFDESSESGWGSIYSSKSSATNIIQLTQVPSDLAKLATEFILWDLYAHAVANGSKNNPLPIVLDEVQNLDHQLDSPLGKMLTEGRKYGLSLILATQTLSNLAKEEQDRLFQASHKLFFAPAKTEIKRYAEILTITVPNSTKKEWIDVLNSLKKGQCLSVGYHLNSSKQLEVGVKKVNVAALANRH